MGLRPEDAWMVEVPGRSPLVAGYHQPTLHSEVEQLGDVRPPSIVEFRRLPAAGSAMPPRDGEDEEPWQAIVRFDMTCIPEELRRKNDMFVPWALEEMVRFDGFLSFGLYSCLNDRLLRNVVYRHAYGDLAVLE